MKSAVRAATCTLLGWFTLGPTLLGCPGTLVEKECFWAEQRAANLLGANCIGGGCHNAEDKIAGVDLESAGLSPRLRTQNSSCGTPIVDPGKPENSLLYTKLFDGPSCGTRMPLGSAELYDEDKEIIRVWIAGLDGSCVNGGTGGAGTGGTAGTGGSTTSTGGSSTGGAGGTGGTGGSTM